MPKMRPQVTAPGASRASEFARFTYLLVFTHVFAPKPDPAFGRHALKTPLPRFAAERRKPASGPAVGNSGRKLGPGRARLLPRPGGRAGGEAKSEAETADWPAAPRGSEAVSSPRRADQSVLALLSRLWQKSATLTASCGSSVVEHSLGKGEVESSILSRSTIFPNPSCRWAVPLRQGRCRRCRYGLCPRALGPAMMARRGVMRFRQATKLPARFDFDGASSQERRGRSGRFAMVRAAGSARAVGSDGGHLSADR